MLGKIKSSFSCFISRFDLENKTAVKQAPLSDAALQDSLHHPDIAGAWFQKIHALELQAQ